MKSPVRLLSAAALTGSTLFIFSHPAAAQLATRNGDWSAWYGCWHAQNAPAREQLCIVPEGDGVRMLTIVDGTTRAETRVIADDRTRDVAQEDCRGNERARWSSDHRRVFLNAELTCGTDSHRTSSGIMAFADGTHWLSVQAVDVDGQTATRSTRYELAEYADVPRDIAALLQNNVETHTGARIIAANEVSESDVNEASRYVDEAAVQEWLHATDSDYEVASGSALDMMDGGRSTVVVERPVYVERPYVTHVVRSCWDPFWGGFVIGVTRHVGVAVNVGCGYRTYYTRYSPWGYDLYGWHAYRPARVVINRYPHYTYRAPIIIRHDNYRDRDRDRDRNWDRDRNSDRDNRYNRDNRDNRNDGNRDGSRVTRGGYTRGDNGQRDNTQRQDVQRETQRQDVQRVTVQRDREPARIARPVPAERSTVRTERSTQSSSTESRSAQPREARRRN